MLRRIAFSLMQLPVRLVFMFDRLAGALRPHWRGRIRGEAVEALLAHQDEVSHEDVRFHVVSPNRLCAYRAESFSDKEPETLEWIDGFDPGGILWDIGANIGLYSLYAVKRHPGTKVYAFEPSVLNLELLARNIAVNGEVGAVCIVPLPLFSGIREDVFKLQRADRGGALSAFSVDYGYDNKPLDFALSYGTLGVSLDDMRNVFQLPQPDHIKMDVDGVEHLILSGGKAVLSDPRLKSILVELNDDFVEQKEMAEDTLTRAGLRLASKKRAEAAFDANAGQVWNNIWVRP
jgi:FkbM family methyltransferase